ncbi:MAG: serpin family protein [Ruminococcus sp.]
MKKRIACLAAAAALCLTACAGESFSDNEFLSRGVARSRDTSLTFNYADGASEPPLAYNSFANTTATFGFKLLRRSYREDGNTAVMPANAILQLSLLLNGAKGDTKQEILFALGNELSADSLNTCSSYFQSRMQTVGRKYLEQQSEDGKDISPTLTIPRMLFLNDGNDFRKTFLQANADFFGADILRFDFADDMARVKLDDLIKTEKPPFDENDSMYSYSSLTFTDTWLTPYGADSSADGTFLHSEEILMQSDRAKGVVKYTETNPLKALFILPDGDFDTYVKTFDSAEYFKLLESVDITKRQGVQLRPFSVDGGLVDRKDTLSAVGLNTLFSDKSDFGNLAHGDANRLDSFFESMPGVTFSASGISTETMQSDAALTQDTAPEKEEWKDDLVFDKPFLFMLIDNESSTPLYIAAIKEI